MKRYISAFVGVSAIALDGSAFSQTETSSDALELDEIIIEGTKRNLSVQEAEVAVEVYTPERLDAESLFDIGYVIRRTPNISSGGSASDIVIRGVSRSGVGGAGQGVT
ncbi:MAG: hypothetical protein AAF583_09140 [Pseudomonadota bacterium]